MDAELHNLLDRPWAMPPRLLGTFLSLAMTRQPLQDPTAGAALGIRPGRDANARQDGATLVLPVYGVMTPRGGWWGVSSEDLAARIREVAGGNQVKTLVLDMDTPGGSVAGIPELAAAVREARAGGIQVVASVNHLAASAGWWVASQADRVVASPSSEVGSIGVFLTHTDWRGAYEKMGVVPTLISAGPYKTEGHPLEPLSEEGRAYLTAQVGDYYRDFLADVAAGRETTPDRVEADYGGGRTLRPAPALAAGMIDGVGTLDALLRELTGRGDATRAFAGPARPDIGTAAADTAAVLELHAGPPNAGTATGDAEKIPHNTTKAPEAEETTVDHENTATPEGAAPNQVTVTRAEAPTGPNPARIAALAAEHGMADRAAGWIEAGTPEAAVLREILAARGRDEPAPVRPGAAMPDIPRSERRDYSISRVILSQVPDANVDAGYEREVSQELARTLERKPEGIFLSSALAFGGRRGPQAAGLDTATTNAGEEMVFEEYAGFIALLRNRSVLLRMGATFLPGLVGDQGFVRQTAGTTVTWVGENPGTDVAEQNLATDILRMSPKIAQVTTSFSRKLLAQSTPAADALARRDLLQAHGTGIDQAGLAGTGGLQPTGILNTAGIGDVDGGTDGSAFTYADAVDLETDVGDANADDLGTMGYITTPGVRGQAKKTEMFTGTSGNPVWSGSATAGEVNGYRAMATRNVPSDLDKGASVGVCHAVIFGAYGEVLVGEWGAADLIVDPYALKKQGMIEVTSHQLVDVGIRYPGAFSARQDVTL